jgi:hypothetical protein
MCKRARSSLVLIALWTPVSLSACSGRAQETLSGATPDGGGAADAAIAESGSGSALMDAGDSVVPDADPVDAGPVDAGPVDVGPVDVGPRPTCGGSGADTDNSCRALQALEFSSPQFGWADGGVGNVVVTITNAGSGVVPYPCFGLTVDQPTANLPTELEPMVYVLKAGQSGTYSFPVEFAGPVPPGTVLHFTVWVDSLNVGCTGVGEFPFVVTTN